MQPPADAATEHAAPAPGAGFTHTYSPPAPLEGGIAEELAAACARFANSDKRLLVTFASEGYCPTLLTAAATLPLLLARKCVLCTNMGAHKLAHLLARTQG